MFQDWIVKQAIAFCVPSVASFLKPYLTQAADKLLVDAARAEMTKIPAADVQKYAGWVVDALAATWGV